mmetsp:Transcript_43434/g.93041  ORF Transcript_43434/g.93041 Transcript_43434/m.93041 type:complete len:345 (-) Transcript_43434:3-1037(-)
MLDAWAGGHDSNDQATLLGRRLLGSQGRQIQSRVEAANLLAFIGIDKRFHQLRAEVLVGVEISEDDHTLERNGPKVAHDAKHPIGRRSAADEGVAQEALEMGVGLVQGSAEGWIGDSAPCLGNDLLELFWQQVLVAALVVALIESVHPIFGGGHTDFVQGKLELVGAQRVGLVEVGHLEDVLDSLDPIGSLLLVELEALSLCFDGLELGMLEGHHAEFLGTVEAEFVHIVVWREGEFNTFGRHVYFLVIFGHEASSAREDGGGDGTEECFPVGDEGNLLRSDDAAPSGEPRQTASESAHCRHFSCTDSVAPSRFLFGNGTRTAVGGGGGRRVRLYQERPPPTEP